MSAETRYFISDDVLAVNSDLANADDVLFPPQLFLNSEIFAFISHFVKRRVLFFLYARCIAKPIFQFSVHSFVIVTEVSAQ